MKKLFSLKTANQLLGAAILACSAQGFAQPEEDETDPYVDWYQVEFIIFKNLDENAKQQEQWPTQKELILSADTQSLNELLNIPLPTAIQTVKEADELVAFQLEQELAKQLLSEEKNTPAEDSIDTTLALTEPEQVTNEEPLGEGITEELSEEDKQLLAEDQLEPAITFIPAAENQLVLDHQANQLNYNKKYQVIYHGGWQQQLSDGQAMTSYRLSVETDGNELDGTINIIRKRFLHVATDLWMHKIAIDTTEIDNTLAQDNIQPLKGIDALAEEIETTSNQIVNTIEYARLYKKERMRSNELHYIDHPLMGMLIRITPFNELTPIEDSVDDIETIEETE